jgi:hypothetical protein
VSPKEIIGAAGKLIADPDKWCQETLARRANGRPSASVFRAQQWDAIGAVYFSAGIEPTGYRITNNLTAALAGLNAAAHELHQMSTERVNDELGHRPVLEVMRRAWKQANDQDLEERWNDRRKAA